MQRLGLFIPLIILPTLAFGQSENPCNDPEINRRWEQAMANQPQNRLVKKLFAKRIELCGLVKNGRLDLKTARSIWEQMLMDSLLDRGQEKQEHQEKQERHNLPALFANFIF